MLTHFQNFQQHAFRLCSLQNYNVEQEQEEFSAFLKTGKVSESEDWSTIIREATKRKAKMSRAQIIEEPLSDYMRYALAKYDFNQAAGEEIFLIKKSIYDQLNLKLTDFWLFDNQTVLNMEYDQNGKYLGFQTITENLQPYIEARQKILQLMPDML